jgi:uncharacterized protein (TIGR00251 family)
MYSLHVQVIPQARRNDVIPISDTEYKVYVTAPAQKGKANKEMLKLLAKHLHLPVSHLLIARGDRSNAKTVLVLDEE